MLKGNIHFIEMNIRGAWVVYGAIGIRQYYGYTKKEAKMKYQQACRETIVTNMATSRI